MNYDDMNAWQRLLPGVLFSPSSRGKRLGVLALALILALAACGRDKGDPVEISKAFLNSLWTQDTAGITALTCSDWRNVTSQWASETGNPATAVDMQHLDFSVISQNDRQITLEMTGIATLKLPESEVEVRDYGGQGAVRFILVDEDGWKVCDVRPVY